MSPPYFVQPIVFHLANYDASLHRAEYVVSRGVVVPQRTGAHLQHLNPSKADLSSATVKGKNTRVHDRLRYCALRAFVAK